MKFQGKVVRKQLGGTLPANAAADSAARIMGGVRFPNAPSLAGIPGVPMNTPAPGVSQSAAIPAAPAAGRRRQSTQDLLQSAVMGGLAGLGGNAGITAGLAMQIIPILAGLMKKGSAIPKKKGGGPVKGRMKNEAGKNAMPKPAKKVAAAKKGYAKGGMMKMKGKAC